MMLGYDTGAPKRPVNMSLNEDLVRKARELTDNLSEQIERLLAEYVLAEQKRRAEGDARLDAAVTAWNDFNERHGSFADEHSTL
jgi:antitoxin CcdA